MGHLGGDWVIPRVELLGVRLMSLGQKALAAITNPLQLA